MNQNMYKFFRKAIIHLKKRNFVKDFKAFDKSSGIGKNGYGDGCTVVGKGNITVGKNCWFGNGCEIIAYDSHFTQPLDANLTIGDNVRVTSRCRITCAGNIVIGNNVLVAPDVFITDHNHGMNPLVERGYSPQPLIVKDVEIKDGVWLGHRVVVLPGVTIGKSCIIGANSVVSRDIPDYCIAAGAPAKVIKKWNFDKSAWEKVN